MPQPQLSLQEIREIVAIGRFDQQTADDIALDCLSRGLSDVEIGKLVMTKKAEQTENDPIMPRIYGSDYENESTRARLMAEALAARCGGPAASDRAHNFVRMSVVDMARHLMEQRGIRTHRLSPGEVITRALTTTGDFTELLTGAGNRILANAYQSYSGGLKRICRQATIADFRAKQVLHLGEAPTLEKVNEHGEYAYGSPVETKTAYSLQTFGRIFGITRQALFHANHGNLAASGGAISVTTLGAARKAMRLQTGIDGVTAIDVAPSYLIVPAALETVAEQFLATLSPTVASDTNPFSGRLELVVDPRLDAKSATAWYLAAKPTSVDTIEYAYLEGFPGPVIETRQGFETDGTEIKARLDFGCGILDWRGLYKNPGA